jgi:hypothetical protein
MMTLKEELARLELGDAREFRNLTVCPLLRPAGAAAEPDYLLLEEAIASGAARVTEVSGGGSVPELRLENRGERPVLLLDGEELVGAKQNRVLNLTILAAGKKETAIPVSCVEAGRWRMDTPEFAPAPHVMYAMARAQRASQVTESMRTTGGRRSDQGAVWDDIAMKAERMAAHSPTGAMNAIYEKHGQRLEEYLRAFECQERQAGVVFRIGGKATGLDLLDHAASMRKVFPKLIRSYALDALDCEGARAEGNGHWATEMLERVSAALAFAEPAVGLGKDVRLAGEGLSGAALWAERRYVHVCAFAGEGIGDAPRWRTRIRRPSRRGGYGHQTEGEVD